MKSAIALMVLLAGAAAAAEIRFDPAANPAEDLRTSMARAKADKKNILIDVRGEWCGWCHRMDNFIAGHAVLTELRASGYVFMKVNFSQENKNQQFLSQYPPVAGYPHLFVLDPNGKLLVSQDMGALEDGRGYSLERFTEFLKKWAPAAK